MRSRPKQLLPSEYLEEVELDVAQIALVVGHSLSLPPQCPSDAAWPNVVTEQ
jgi:hypothetical protein